MKRNKWAHGEKIDKRPWVKVLGYDAREGGIVHKMLLNHAKAHEDSMKKIKYPNELKQ